MDSGRPAQASEMPLNMSDYVNFDLVIDIPNPTVGSSPRSSVGDPLQNMRVDDSYVGFDTVDEAAPASMFGSPDSSNAFFVGPDATSVVSAESGETDAAFRDSNTLSPTSEDSDMTDTFQTRTETGVMSDHIDMFEPMAFTNPAVLEIPRSPSRWVPVSPQLQQQLNAVYASQLSQLAADPNPPPVLYLPAERPCAPPMHSSWSVPSDDLPQTHLHQTDFPRTLQLNAEPLSVDPTSLMRSKGEVSPLLASPNGTSQPVLPTTDFYVSNGENPELSPTKKRTLDLNSSDSTPATKRIKTAKPLTIAVGNLGSSEEDDAEMMRAQSPRHDLLLNVAKDERSADASDEEVEDNLSDESDNNDSSGSSSAPASPLAPPTPVTKGISVPLSSNTAPKNGLNWRYELAKETRLRNQRRKEWNRRRVDGPSNKGEAPNRKMQKLLEEIEDTMEFAEARGYEVGESMRGDGVLRRSARRGARKNYAGLE